MNNVFWKESYGELIYNWVNMRGRQTLQSKMSTDFNFYIQNELWSENQRLLGWLNSWTYLTKCDLEFVELWINTKNCKKNNWLAWSMRIAIVSLIEAAPPRLRTINYQTSNKKIEYALTGWASLIWTVVGWFETYPFEFLFYIWKLNLGAVINNWLQLRILQLLPC